MNKPDIDVIVCTDAKCHDCHKTFARGEFVLGKPYPGAKGVGYEVCNACAAPELLAQWDAEHAR